MTDKIPMGRDRLHAGSIGVSGREAVDALMAAALREELLDAGVVARALGASKRKMLRDWRRRGLPITKVGRDITLPATLVVSIYFSHRNSGH